MNKLFIDNMDLKDKKVLLRVDFNVPLDEEMQITDDIRITAALPTIKKILSENAKLIIVSHLGRPKGQPNPKFSLKPVAFRLNELLNKEVKFADDCIGDKVKTKVNELQPGELILLENLRFHEGETKNDP